MYAQINPQDDGVSLLDIDVAYPGGGWEIIRPLLENAGYQFIELEAAELPGTHYDQEIGFYTPEPPSPPEPTQEELNNLALMEGIAGLYEAQIDLEDRMATDNLTVMEGIAGLFEVQMGGM